MSKSGRSLRMLKKAADKVPNPNVRLYIPAGMATPGPPLGPQLGQSNINVAQFCKEFNEKTKDMKPGIPVPCKIAVKPDRTFSLLMHKPPVSYFIKQAAGCEKGSMCPGTSDVAGMVSLKHIYEIAKIKSQDPTFDCVPLQEVCQSLIDSARTVGVVTVPKLTVEEYRVFLEERKKVVDAQTAELEEGRKAKLLRQTKAAAGL